MAYQVCGDILHETLHARWHPLVVARDAFALGTLGTLRGCPVGLLQPRLCRLGYGPKKRIVAPQAIHQGWGHVQSLRSVQPLREHGESTRSCRLGNAA